MTRAELERRLAPIQAAFPDWQILPIDPDVDGPTKGAIGCTAGRNADESIVVTFDPGDDPVDPEDDDPTEFCWRWAVAIDAHDPAKMVRQTSHEIESVEVALLEAFAYVEGHRLSRPGWSFIGGQKMTRAPIGLPFVRGFNKTTLPTKAAFSAIIQPDGWHYGGHVYPSLEAAFAACPLSSEVN